MIKRNVILQTAVASAVMAICGAASAGTIATTFKTYASEVFGAGSSATALNFTPITYQFGVPIAANQPIQVYVALSGGAKFVAGKVAAGDLVCRDAANVAVVTGLTNISTDSTYAVFSVTPVNGFSTSNTCTFSPQAGAVNNADTALAVSGGTISATLTLDSGAATLAGVPSGGTNLDSGGTHTGSVAQSAAAITARYVASTSFPFSAGGLTHGTLETKAIDVAAAPTTSKFTVGSNGAATNVVNLGALVFSNVSGTQDDGAGADYTIAAKTGATALSAVVTGDFSLAEAAAASKGTFFATDLACTTQVALPAAGAVTYNTGKTTATISGITTPATGVPYYVCMTISPTNSTAITPSAYSATASLSKTAGTELANSVASSLLLATKLNGKVAVVRNYIPAAVTGYIQSIRIINTGAVAAVPSLTLINEDGTSGTTVSVGSSVASGGALRLSQAQVESLIGTQAQNARPRIRVSASTDGLEVQSFFTNANGAYTNISGTE